MKIKKTNLLIAGLLVFSCRQLFSNFMDRGIHGVSSNQIARIREVWQQRMPLIEKSRELELAMAGVYEKIAPKATDFSPKYDHLAAMSNLMDLVDTGFVVPTSEGISLRETLQGKIASFWNAFCTSKGTLQAIVDAIKRAPLTLSSLLAPERLTKLFAESSLVMVRSSGTEDGKITNAGGHLSAPATREGLLDMIRKVFASFFAQDALENRRKSGGNPCKEELAFGILLQPLINGTSSFVHFSGIPSVTSSTWGFGKGVVEGGVGTDTFHCVPSAIQPKELYCHQHIGNKPRKWVVHLNGIEKVDNPKSLVTQSSLTSAQVIQIHHIGLLLKYFFHYPEIDFEGVDNKLVQARPLTISSSSASYFDEEIENILPIEVLVFAHNAVVIISRQEEILFARDLREAQKLLNLSLHKLVVISREGPVNSHYALNFDRAYRVPVVRADLKMLSFPHAFCLQTERAFPWDPTFGSKIRTGQILYAGKITPSSPFQLNAAPPREIRALIYQLSRNSNALAELERSLQPLFDKMRAIAPTFPAVEPFEKTLHRSLQELRTLPLDDPRRPFFAKILYASLRVDAENSIDLLRSSQKELPHLFDLLLPAQYIPDAKAFAHWKDFLRRFDSQLETHEVIRHFVSLLDASHTFLFWLIFFPPTSLDSFPPIDTSLTHFLTPKTWTPSYEEIASFAQTFSSPSFIETLKQASGAIRTILYGQMRKLVENFDEALKETRDVEQYRQRLRLFLNLLETWVRAFYQELGWRGEFSFFDLLRMFSETFSSHPDQLQVTTEFVVAQALLGSDVLSSTPMLPQSLADIQTWVHQNALRVIAGLLQKQLNFTTAFLPKELREAIESIETKISFQIEGEDGRNHMGAHVRIHRVGVEVSREGFKIYYEIPIRSHGILVVLNSAGELNIKFIGLDPDEGDSLAVWAELLRDIGIFPHTKMQKEREEFLWIVKTDKVSLLRALEECVEMAKYTIHRSFYEVFVRMLRRLDVPKLYPAILEIARKEGESDEMTHQLRAIEIWMVLLPKGYFKDALAWVKEDFSKKSATVQMKRLELIKHLREAGIQGLPQ